mgnify:CR=1 FL=1
MGKEASGNGKVGQKKGVSGLEEAIADWESNELAQVLKRQPETKKSYETAAGTPLKRVYSRLDVTFDHTMGESCYQPLLAGVVDDLTARGMARESRGAVGVFLEGYESPLLVQKADGAFLYATTDLATLAWRAEHWKPDRILGHSGWGETLGLSAIWPDVPQILWPELWIRPEHGGYGVDPLKPRVTLESQLDQLGRNAMTRAALADAMAWVLPTEHQANSLPSEFRNQRLHVIHEGIDTQLAQPNPAVSFELRGIKIDRSVPTITLVNRNLERLRGFDVFMRALPIILSNQSNG